MGEIRTGERTFSGVGAVGGISPVADQSIELQGGSSGEPAGSVSVVSTSRMVWTSPGVPGLCASALLAAPVRSPGTGPPGRDLAGELGVNPATSHGVANPDVTGVLPKVANDPTT
jgi:hypothetical protein